MARVAAEDRQAQRALAIRLMARARKIASSMLRSPADRDDAVQVGLLEVLRSAGGYRGDATIERWADRIVVHTALRIARNSRRATERIDASADVDRVEERGGPTASREGESLEECLEQLPDACRSVLILRHVLGYSIDDIAELTGASPNTVKDRLVRGRTMLRRLVRRSRMVDVARAAGVR